MNNSLSHTQKRKSTITDKLEKFIRRLFQDSPRQKYAAVSLPLNAIDPLACLEMHWKSNTFQYYWEKPSDDIAIAAAGELFHITSSGKNRFRAINERIKIIQESTAEYSFGSHSYSGLMFLGGFSFSDTISGNTWNSFEPASFTVPKWAIIRDGEFHLLTITVDLDAFYSPQKLFEYLLQKINSFENVAAINPNRPVNGTEQKAASLIQNKDAEYSRWSSSVNRAKELIDQGVFKKIVLARHISRPLNSKKQPTQLINTLRRQYTNCYNFLIHHPNSSTFIGSTPERLASFRNNLLMTEALAGSIQRGTTATEDAILEKNLSGSSKNRHEHSFVVKDIEQRLKPLVDNFNRRHQPEVKKLTNVQHLHTPIRANLKNNVDILSIVEQLHPTPAVGGYPRKKAALYINELENIERGWYAGPVGWLNAKGLGEFAVAIRSGLLTESKAHFYAGCGIVADSDAEAEWNEMNLKFQPMLSALQND